MITRRISDASQERTFPLLLVLGLGLAGVLGFVLPDLGMGAVVLLVAPAMVLLLLKYEMLGLCLLVASLPVENVFTVGEGVTATRILGIVVAGLWMWRKLVLRESPMRHVSSRLVQAMIVVFLTAFASVLWSTHTAPTLVAVVSLAQLIFLSVLIIDLVSTWERVATLLMVVVATGVVAAGLTLEQYYVGGARRAGADIAGGINGTAAMLVSIMPFAFYLLRSQDQRIFRLLGALYIVLGTLAVVVTFSRSSYGLLSLLVAVQFWHGLKARTTRKWFVILLVVVIFAASFAPQESVWTRFQAIGPAVQGLAEGISGRSSDPRGFFWAVGLAVFADNPILGAGYNSYGYEFGRYQFRLDSAPRYWNGPRGAHSSFIACLADQGLVGMIAWLLLFVVAGGNLLSARRYLAKGTNAGRVLLLQAITYSFALQSTYAWVLEVRQNKTLWLILGLSVVVQQLAKRSLGQMEERGGEDSSAVGPPSYGHGEGQPRWAT